MAYMRKYLIQKSIVFLCLVKQSLAYKDPVGNVGSDAQPALHQHRV
jgi:hypothetical protein